MAVSLLKLISVGVTWSGILLFTLGTAVASPARLAGVEIVVPSVNVQLVGARRESRLADDEAAAVFEEGQYEFDAQDFTAAARIFRVVVARYPDSRYALKAQKFLAIIYRQRSEREDVPLQSLRPVKAKTPQQGSPLQGDDQQRPDSQLEQRVGGLPGVPMPAAPSVPPQKRWVAAQQEQGRFILATGDRVFFADNSVQLGRKARLAIAKQAGWLSNKDDIRLQVIGHADDRGGARDNDRLSRERAEVVRDLLVAKGIPAERIEVVSAGRGQKVANCAGSQCAAQNRRVTVRLMHEDTAKKDVSARPLTTATR